MPGRRHRAGVRRRGRRQGTDHESEQSAPATETGEVEGAGGGPGGEPGAPDVQTSLDQVLRRADVARRAEREQDG